MTFTHPSLLYLLWLMPALVLLLLAGRKRRQRIMDSYGLARTLSPISRRLGPLTAWSKGILLMVSMTCLIVALAGLHYGHTWERIERKGVSLVLALDCSKSMRAKDISPNRLERAKWEIRDLLNMLHGDKVGLVAFAGTAFVQCPVTLDYSGFELFLQALTPDTMPVGGTDLGAAITTAINAFDPKESSEKAIILITDGETTTGNPLEQAQHAAEQGIKIFCIGMGQPDGAPIPGKNKGFIKDKEGHIVLSRLDEKTLQGISSLTGGTYVRSTTGDMDLETIYTQEILGKMQAMTLTGGKKKTSIDRYAWLTGLALLALFLELLLRCPKNALLGCCVFLGLVTATTGHALENPFITEEGRGTAAYEHKKWEKARNHFLKALVDTPDDPALAYNLGNTAFRAKNYEEAASLFATAAQTNATSLRHKALYNRGNALFRLKNYEEALASYEKAAQIIPNDEDTQENIAFVKKLLEQQKRQKNQQQNNKQDNKDSHKQQQDNKKTENDKNKKENNATQQKNTSDKQKKKNQQENKKNTDADIPDTIKEQKLAGQKNQQADGEQADQNQQAAESPQNAARQSSKTPAQQPQTQAQKMLNRLKDHPGKALIPRSQPQTIQRDW